MKIVKTSLVLLLLVFLLASCEKNEMVDVVPNNTTSLNNERRAASPIGNGPIGIGEIAIDIIKDGPKYNP